MHNAADNHLLWCGSRSIWLSLRARLYTIPVIARGARPAKAYDKRCTHFGFRECRCEYLGGTLLGELAYAIA